MTIFSGISANRRLLLILQSIFLLTAMAGLIPAVPAQSPDAGQPSGVGQPSDIGQPQGSEGETGTELTQMQDGSSQEDNNRDSEAAVRSFTARVSDELIRLGIPQPLPFLWDLSVQGGIFMIPIGLCSIVVLAYAIERRIGLRKGRVIPRGLLVSLQKLNQETNGIDPRTAYEVCNRYPSPVSRVLQAAILKVGRPQAELEKAVEDAVSREGDQMARNLRPINVAASISPLLGLLGTVQGMITAFMVISASTSTGAAKGQELAQGIYTALVTTFAGLCVAIPAIIIANLLESRIERLIRGMEDVFNEIVPLFERFEGKWRVSRRSDGTGVILKGTTPRSDAVTAAPSGTTAASRPVADESTVTAERKIPRPVVVPREKS